MSTDLRNEESRILPCKMTDEETLKLSRSLVKKINDRSVIESEKKGMTAEYKKKVDQLNAEILTLTEKVSSGNDTKQILCYWEYDFHKMEGALRRGDTHEIVDRKMLSVEDQPSV